MELCGVCLYTNDVERLVIFYELIFQEKREGDNKHSAFNSKQLAIYNPKDINIIYDKRIALMYYVEDVDKEYLRIKKLNESIRIVNEPTDKPWGVRSFQFLDPDGNEISFITPHKKKD